MTNQNNREELGTFDQSSMHHDWRELEKMDKKKQQPATPS